MTTVRSKPGNPGATRGRGLDALFDGATGPVSVIGAGRDIDADLAALLDDEVIAAETGIQPGSVPPPAPEPDPLPVAPPPQPVAAARAPAPREALPGPAAEPIDVPPSAAEARPAPAPEPAARPEPEPVVAPAAPPVSAPAEPSVAPAQSTARRFGAIIMESAPAPAVSADPNASLVPKEYAPADRPVAPGVEPGTLDSLPVNPDRTEDEKAIVISRLDQVLPAGWQRALHQQIDGLYKQVTTEFSSPPEKAERALFMLREARTLLIDSPDEYVNAEYRMMQVRAMLDRVKESRSQSVHYGPRVLGYQAAWLVVLLAGLLFAAPLTEWITRVGAVRGAALLNLYPLINTMIWGGIGGIVGGLYTLWWHISQEQDFDRQYLMWYLVQPLMGVVLGGIIFLVLAGGFLILNVSLSDAQASEGARLLPYLAAVLAGFRQNFVYDQLERLIGLFTPPVRKTGNGEGPSA